MASASFIWSWDRMISTSGEIIFSDAWKLRLDVSVGLINSIPLCLTSRSLVSFEQGGRPMSAGMNDWWIASSSSWNRSLITGIVLCK